MTFLRPVCASVIHMPKYKKTDLDRDFGRLLSKASKKHLSPEDYQELTDCSSNLQISMTMAWMMAWIWIRCHCDGGAQLFSGTLIVPSEQFGELDEGDGDEVYQKEEHSVWVNKVRAERNSDGKCLELVLRWMVDLVVGGVDGLKIGRDIAGGGLENEGFPTYSTLV
ncbi:hypothetical protein B0H14DRAFT_2592975 [Mycena olivaceomarginata]|nr:hypothetical protein B0H14DRAFT_2592975 [Mycena olivaceomarginata]